MAPTFWKLLALLIALGYLVAFIIWGKPAGGGSLMLAILLLFVLSLIWCPEAFGVTPGWPPWRRKKKSILDTFGLAGHPSYRDSHAGMFVFLGWFFLIGIPIIFYLLGR